LCRPGSIIGPQQTWLVENEKYFITLGEKFRCEGKRIPIHPDWLRDGDSE